jgi:hypothetical protein
MMHNGRKTNFTSLSQFAFKKYIIYLRSEIIFLNTLNLIIYVLNYGKRVGVIINFECIVFKHADK